jgi:hypothetical protein
VAGSGSAACTLRAVGDATPGQARLLAVQVLQRASADEQRAQGSQPGPRLRCAGGLRVQDQRVAGAALERRGEHVLPAVARPSAPGPARYSPLRGTLARDVGTLLSVCTQKNLLAAPARSWTALQMEPALVARPLRLSTHTCQLVCAEDSGHRCVEHK